MMNPASVSLLGVELDGVRFIAVDRRAQFVASEWGDAGPHVVFADVPEQRVGLVLSRELSCDELRVAAPGDQGELVVHVSPTAGDLGRTRVRATVVVEEVSHRVSARSAEQTIRLVAVSSDGRADPVVVERA